MADRAQMKVKRLWKETGKGLRLKQFARELVNSGEQVAKDWFANKGGETINREKAAREKNKGPTLTIIRQAVKASRSKSK